MVRLTTAMEFSAAVRAKRRALGLTQRDLALAAGLGRVAVLRLENDPEKCQLQTALRVAETLGLRLTVLDDLVARSAVPPTSPPEVIAAEQPRREEAPADLFDA